MRFSKKKAQVATEFMFLAGFLFFIFLILIAIINQRTIGMQEERFDRMLEEVGDIIESEIDIAMSVRNGYQRTFKLPINLDGYDYTLDYDRLKQGKELREIKITYDESLNMAQKHIIFVPREINLTSINPGKNLITKIDSQITII